MFRRYLLSQIEHDLAIKMVFIAGPRQVGKTTLAKALLKDPSRYLTWDDISDRERLLRHELPAGRGVIVLDEVHKYARWRQLLKGAFDKRGGEISILVTGSAKLDYYRYGGDSLQGRYHLLRMHPLSVLELGDSGSMQDLFNLGGFPEPFFGGSQDQARRWSREYRSRIIYEELAELEQVSELSLVDVLSQRLPDLVGSLLSVNSLREDLQVAHQTVQGWLTKLERLYHIFRIYPFGSPKIKAIKKAFKHYHMDWNLIAEPGPRFENFMACHLLKHCNYIEDTQGYDMELRFFRDIDRREVDFVVLKDRKPQCFIEAKYKDTQVETPLRYLKSKFPNVTAVQVVYEFEDDFIDKRGIRIVGARQFLKELAV